MDTDGNPADFRVLGEPTPGVADFLVVPEPGTGVLVGFGLVLTVMRSMRLPGRWGLFGV